jgi:rare lipoprotein A
MIAMNGSSPSAIPGIKAAAFPGQLANPQSAFGEQPTASAQASLSDFAQLPEFGPIVPQRPDFALPSQAPFAMAALSYADERVERAWGAFTTLEEGGNQNPEWKRADRSDRSTSSADDYVAAGTFETETQARVVASRLSGVGRSEIQQTRRDGKTWYSLNLYPNGQSSLDDILQAAWSHGAPDALAVHD